MLSFKKPTNHTMKIQGRITLICLYILFGAIAAKMGFAPSHPAFWFFIIPANLAAYLICSEIFKKEKKA
jgi:fatty acid desaturase